MALILPFDRHPVKPGPVAPIKHQNSPFFEKMADRLETFFATWTQERRHA